MSFQRSAVRKVPFRRAALFQIEGLERRLLLSSAIAAFGAQQTFATGANPRSVAVADVNSDGKPDLVVANSTGNTVGVLLGNGNGTYQTQQTFAVGSNPFSVAVSDVSADGKLDILTANNGGSSVSVLLGNGNGTFQPQKTFAAGANSRFVAIADVNGDGKPDAMVANYGAGTISVLLGNGDGTFQNQQTFSTGTKPSSIAVADFNGDGKPDLAIANKGSNNVSILLNSGTGTFPTQQVFSVGTNPFSVAATDLNRDGRIDLAVANESTNNVSVLLGNGNGTFQNQQTFSAGTIPCALAVSDINGDGNPDLVTANYTSNNVSVLLGNGDGIFQTQATFATGANPFALTVADVNQDTREDLLIANEGSSTISELLGDVTPFVVSINRFNPSAPSTSASSIAYSLTFNEPVNGVTASDFRVVTTGTVAVTTPATIAGTGSSYSVTVGGVHGSGTLQLELVDNDSITDSVGTPLGAPGIGNGSFIGQSYTILQAFPTLLSITQTSPPQAITSASSVTYTITFSEQVTGVNPSDFSLALNGVTAPTPVVVGGSGAVYTVSVNGITGDGTLALNVVNDGSIRDSAGNPLAGGSVTFLQQQTFSAGNNPIGVAAADLNGDGRTDIAVTNLYDGSVGVLLGNGNGTFQAQHTYAVELNPVQVVTADVNGDGIPDLIVANNGGDISVLLGNGNGTFRPQSTLISGVSPHSIAVADLNGDGKLDIVVANSNSGDVGVYLGNGNGTFQPPRTYATGSLPYSIAVADMNGDGKQDVLVTQSVTSVVGVLLGNGDGTFQAQQTFSSPGFATSISVGDFNGDGNQDVAVTHENDSTVGVLLGNGNGMLQPQRDVSVVSDPVFVGSGDVSEDGKLDLIATSGLGSPAVDIVTGNGDDTFALGQTFVTGSAVWSAAVAEFNGDGRADLVVADRNTASVGVFLTANPSFTGPVYTFVPLITSIDRSAPVTPVTGLSSVSYSVTFGRSVTGVAASNFRVTTTGSVVAGGPIIVSGSGSSYTVTISGVHGNGSLQLELVDNDSIVDVYGTLLGGPGVGNGSFNGQSFTILQTFPTVLSIDRTNPSSPTTSAATVSYTVTFSKPVSGVNASDFALALNGVSATTPVVVSGSGAAYTVTVNGISGDGTLGLNLIDDGSIRDAASNPLQLTSAGYFQSVTTFAAGTDPESIAEADLNGDGNVDLVVANFTRTVQVLLGRGNGTFQVEPPFSNGLGNSLRSCAVADLNGDGIPDVIVPDPSDGVVDVFLGNGNGTFLNPVTFVCGGGFVAVADLNGDGRPDLVVAYAAPASVPGASKVTVFLGNGNGTFQQQPRLSVGTTPRCVAVADVNGDNNPDLIVTNYADDTVSVLLGNGNGTFQPQQTFGTGTYPVSVAVADMNGDGKPDLVIANRGKFAAHSTVSVLLGNGDGTFAAQQTFQADINSSEVAITDINGDGNLDVVVSNSYSGDLSLLLGSGNGTLQAQQKLVVEGASVVPFVTVADVNNDGRPDIVTSDGFDNVDVLIANGDGNFTGQVYTVVPLADTINGTGGNDSITLTSDSDGSHVDWTMASAAGQLAITDPNGLTINGDSGSDTIFLNYGAGDANPLPNLIHLNGDFTINGLQGSNPLANTNLEIGRSTVYVTYSSSDPLSLIQGYLRNGYNNGAWTGSTGSPQAGEITSIPAAQNAAQTTAIGYADSADGLIAGQPVNTIELKYTLYGDTTLTGNVGFNDFTRLTQHYNQTTGGTWDTGDFNYDGSVNFADFTLMTRTYNTSLGSQASPAVFAAAQPASGSAAPSGAAAPVSSGENVLPVVQTKPPASAGAAHAGTGKHPKKHRR